MAPIIRWMIRRDMPEVMDIEELCYDFPWSEEDFLRQLRHNRKIGMVAEYDEAIVGYMIYALSKRRLDILNLAVRPSVQRNGIGRAMVETLKGKLSEQRRKLLRLEISENNTAGQLFFRAMEFRAVRVLRSHYENDSDAYVMQYQHRVGASRTVPTLQKGKS